MVIDVSSIILRNFLVGGYGIGSGEVMIKGAPLGVVVFLIGPLVEILARLLEMVIIDTSSHKLFAEGTFSKRIS